MPHTPLIAIALGFVLALLYGACLLRPEAARTHLLAYPRQVWPARILMLVALVWFAWNLWQVDFGPFSKFKPVLYAAVPIGWILATTYIPDLLAVRSLCCVLLLAGNPLLIETRWHGSPAQYAIGIFVYLLMVKCMVLVVYPHLWKRGVHWAYAKPGRAKTGFTGGLGVALVLLGCGLASL